MVRFLQSVNDYKKIPVFKTTWFDKFWRDEKHSFTEEKNK